MWLGDVLPSIPKKLHDHMLRWEFITFAELKPTDTLDKLCQETESHQYIILPGVEVARAKHKLVEDIHTWLQYFGVYVAAMSKQFPECGAGSDGLYDHHHVTPKKNMRSQPGTCMTLPSEKRQPQLSVESGTYIQPIFHISG